VFVQPLALIAFDREEGGSRLALPERIVRGGAAPASAGESRDGVVRHKILKGPPTVPSCPNSVTHIRRSWLRFRVRLSPGL